MADAIVLSTPIAAVGLLSGRGSRAASTRSGGTGLGGTASGETAPLSSALSLGVIGAATGAPLGADTLASLVGLQGSGGAATGGQGTTAATTATTTTTETEETASTTQESETVFENGQVVRVTRTIQVDANGVRKVVAESRHVVYGTTLASLAYQNTQALLDASPGALLGIA